MSDEKVVTGIVEGHSLGMPMLFTGIAAARQEGQSEEHVILFFSTPFGQALHIAIEASMWDEFIEALTSNAPKALEVLRNQDAHMEEELRKMLDQTSPAGDDLD